MVRGFSPIRPFSLFSASIKSTYDGTVLERVRDINLDLIPHMEVLKHPGLETPRFSFSHF